MGIPARPVVVLIDDRRRSENLPKAIVGAVHISDGDDPLDTAPFAGIRRAEA
jgi:hypothetical protein